MIKGGELSPGQTIATWQRNISQHCWAQHVACVWPPCCDVLSVVGSNFTIFKLEPETTIVSQHSATRWQTHATCCAQQCCDMLRCHACCDRLALALSLIVRFLILIYFTSFHFPPYLLPRFYPTQNVRFHGHRRRYL